MWLYPEVRTLGDFIEYHARHDPARPALLSGSRVVDFATFERVANTIAHGLGGRGVGLGDRVGFLGLNSLDFYFSLVGTVKNGSAFTPFNWRASALELARLVEDSAACLVFVEHHMRSLWEAAAAVATTKPDVVWFDETETLEAIFADRSGEPVDIGIGEDETAIQLYTSGTTGHPKGVMLTHGGLNRIRLCEHLEPAFQWRDGDIFINALPNFHLLSVGIAFQCLYNGVAVSVVRQFDPKLVLATIARDRPTLLTLTPTMIAMLLDHPDASSTDFSSLRLTLYAGSPISLGLIRRALSIMPCAFMQFYGATEAGGAFSILRPDEHDLDDDAKLQSCGRPLPLIQFRIVDANGDEVPDGEAGELLIRTPSITSGYWRNPQATAEVLQHGWYRSGDIARKDDEGLYYIIDRAKDMIVSGGENIYSAEVENVLSLHPAVASVAVIGVPDARWGEAVKAVVVLTEGSAPAEDELIAWSRARIAAYKAPKSIDFVTSLPLVPTGKVSKRDLRARYWEGQVRSIA